jgi:triacylglycerol esterase/lipase EstA (alpha/beta hydrolase family)
MFVNLANQSNIIIIFFKSMLSISQKIKIVGIALLHLILTLPSAIYHSLKNEYYKYTTKKSKISSLLNKNVIVFVHGRNGAPSDFIPLINNIKEISQPLSNDEIKINENQYILRSISLGNTNYTSIEQDADSLNKQLEMFKYCSIVLIGMSKGGVVVMKYATRNNPQIKKVITISSPLKGTLVASLLPLSSSVFTNLGYMNDVVQQINIERKNISSQTQIYHVVTKFDLLIIPSSSAKYDDTPESNIYYYNGFKYSHAGILYNIEVAKNIIKWLSNYE